MALRARPDNLALDQPLAVEADAAPDFAELWEHREKLRAASRRLVGDDSTAEDIVQDTFLRALGAKRLQRRASVAPWLATVARRRSIDELRAESRVLPMAAPPMQSASADDPLEQVLLQERAARLSQALATLTPRERQLLLRQAAHGLSVAELAAEEATSVGSVRSVLTRARTKLRSSLERGGPLGATPLPRLVAGCRRQLHRWGMRVEGGMPVLAGAGSQFADVVGAAIAAAALLLAGTVPAAPERPSVALAAVERPVEGSPASPSPAPAPGGTDPGHPSERHPASAAPVSGGAPQPGDEAAVPPLVQPPGLELPGLPADEADQPEEVHVQRVAASSDGRTVIISGIKDASAETQGEGLYRSDDGGHTWRWLEAGGYVHGYAVIPPGFATHDTLFVVSDPLVLRSDNGGRSFEPIGYSRGGVAALPLDPADRRIFIAPAGLTAYDAGTRQTTPYTATPNATSLGSLAVRSATGTPAFVVGIVGSTPGGTAQGYVQRCNPTACEPPVALPGLRFAPRVFASSAVPGLVLASSLGRLYRSVDGGATFTQVAVPAGTIHTIVDGAPGELLLARANSTNTSSSGLLRSVDGGLTWSPLGMGTPLQQGAEGLAYLSTGRIVAGINNKPGFRCSVDGGLTWASRCPA